jgi:hypothetical protein
LAGERARSEQGGIVKKKTIYVLVGCGVVFMLLAILWWAFAPGILIKLPEGIDVSQTAEGEITLYFDLATGQSLPAGEEITLPMAIVRNLNSLDDEYDAHTGLIREQVDLEIGGMPQGEGQDSVYVVDRKSMQNIDDPRAYDNSPDNRVDRSGSYYPILPFEDRDATYYIWKAEIGAPVAARYIGEETIEGVTVFRVGGTMEVSEKIEVAPSYVSGLGLPAEVSFEEVKAGLAQMGADVEGILALAVTVLSPQDLEALNQAMQQPVPLEYYWSGEVEALLEPETGMPMGNRKDVEGLSVEPDYAALGSVTDILVKYAGDPQLGPALLSLASLESTLGESEPRKVFEYSWVSDEDSIAESAADAKGTLDKMKMVEFYIPLGLAAVSCVLLLAAGGFYLRGASGRRKAGGPA